MTTLEMPTFGLNDSEMEQLAKMFMGERGSDGLSRLAVGMRGAQISEDLGIAQRQANTWQILSLPDCVSTTKLENSTRKQ